MNDKEWDLYRTARVYLSDDIEQIRWFMCAYFNKHISKETIRELEERFIKHCHKFIEEQIFSND